MLGVGLIGAVLAVGPGSGAAVEQRTYVATAGVTCGGYPRVTIATLPGICAGLIIQPPAGQTFSSRQLKMPRVLLPLGGDDWLVSDLGAWLRGQGAVWKLTAKPGAPAQLTAVLSKLDMPHTLARGPDGAVYVGEMGRISRFDPAAADPMASRQVVVDGLPDNRLHDNRHPLSSFLFDVDGALLVNVGAPSDQCAPVDPAQTPGRCAEAEGLNAAGAIRRYAYLGKGRWSPTWTIFARGLRNSLAMVRGPTGAIIQAENGIDLADAASPYEEINVVKAGGNYGWPYCMDRDRPTPVWGAAAVLDCKSAAHAKPALLLPPHGAPLGMTYYQGAMFPQLKGRLLLSLHGPRTPGARLVAYAADAAGVPTPTKAPTYAVYGPKGALARKAYPKADAPFAATPLVVTTDWRMTPSVRPRGWPVGIAVAPDGAIWLADDHNGAIIRLAKDAP